jgi:hypothetical protein
VWGLTVPAAAAVEGLLALLARLTVESDPKPMVEQLDVATRLLVTSAGEPGGSAPRQVWIERLSD